MSAEALRDAAADADQTFGTGAIGDDVKRCPDCPPELMIYVDLDRDGNVDETHAPTDIWRYGVQGRGAVVRVNNDDDDSDKKLDDDDDRINGTEDIADLAPIRLKREPASRKFPPGYRAILTTAVPASDPSGSLVWLSNDYNNHRFFRLFGGRTVGATEVIGPSKGYEYEIKDLTPESIDLAMEALRYPGWNLETGEIVLRLAVLDPRGRLVTFRTAVFHIAPWLVHHHNQPTLSVYVVEQYSETKRSVVTNETFLNELEEALKLSPGVKLEQANGRWYGYDRWMQDAMELGYATAPNAAASSPWNVPVVLRSPEDRWMRRATEFNPPHLDEYPRTLLAKDFGYLEVRPPVPRPPPPIDDEMRAAALKIVNKKGWPPSKESGMNDGGNLECSPPVRLGKRKFPFGRIVYGSSPSEAEEMTPELRSMLYYQQVQSPFQVDTSWLYVGHVDEAFSFCPFRSDPDPFKKFRIIMASAKAAIDVLYAASKIPNVASDLLEGMSHDGLTDAEVASELKKNFPRRKVKEILDDTDFMNVQLAAQKFLDATEATLLSYLGLEKKHVLYVPVLWTLGKLRPELPINGKQSPPRFTYRAYTPNCVNMLVVTRRDGSAVLAIPKPFGPKINGVCQFEAAIKKGLASALSADNGNTCAFIDDFFSYHVAYGNVHCGTNSSRDPGNERWWNYPPAYSAQALSEDK